MIQVTLGPSEDSNNNPLNDLYSYHYLSHAGPSALGLDPGLLASKRSEREEDKDGPRILRKTSSPDSTSSAPSCGHEVGRHGPPPTAVPTWSGGGLT